MYVPGYTLHWICLLEVLDIYIFISPPARWWENIIPWFCTFGRAHYIRWWLNVYYNKKLYLKKIQIISHKVRSPNANETKWDIQASSTYIALCIYTTNVIFHPTLLTMKYTSDIPHPYIPLIMQHLWHNGDASVCALIAAASTTWLCQKIIGKEKLSGFRMCEHESYSAWRAINAITHSCVRKLNSVCTVLNLMHLCLINR